jgi:hypothetical protein
MTGPTGRPVFRRSGNATGGYKLSILKSCDGNEKSVQRLLLIIRTLAGEGHFISTYKCNGTPIPSFTGEPLRVAVDEEDPNEYAGGSGSPERENKVSLFVRAIDSKPNL